MPVSIIGTFAVMLLIGYSANTVSLLALVLAIGIVVDDAIVVVESIERVIEEEPDPSVPDACKKAMAEITGPILPSPSCCCRSLCRSAQPHMFRHACGFQLANQGTDTRTLQAYLGHRNIQHTVRYTELSPTRFKNLWRD